MHRRNDLDFLVAKCNPLTTYQQTSTAAEGSLCFLLASGAGSLLFSQSTPMAPTRVKLIFFQMQMNLSLHHP